MHVLFSAAVIACPLQTKYFPGSDSLILDTKTVHSKEDEGKLQSWTKVGILLNFWGVFQFTHTLPLPSPHKQRSLFSVHLEAISHRKIARNKFP